MKLFLPPGAAIKLAFRLAIVLLFPLVSYTQTFFGSASSLADPGSATGATATITPPAAMLAGDLVIIYAHHRYTSGTLDITPANEAGQTWTRENQSNGTNQRTCIFWCRFNGTWAGDPVVTRTGGSGSQPLTAIMYVFRPSTTTTWGVHLGPNSANSASATVSITGLTTTVPNTVTMAFWGSQDDNTWGVATGAGWNSTGTAQYRNSGGSDQSHTAAYKIQAAAGATGNVSKTQAAADASRTSIISWYEFTPVVNDECANAVPLNSSSACTTTAGTLVNATYVTVPGACGASSGNRNDVWYSFVANSTNPTITLSSFSQRSLQLFSGTCGSLSSVQCAVSSSSLTASGLTINDTYYVRVWSDDNTASAFNICVTDPPPVNDLCGGAITLTSSGACVSTTGTLLYATYTAIPAIGCGVASRNDVWYRFVAQTTNPVITLTTALANPRLQLFSGTCASLTSIACGIGSVSPTGLTVGSTYYIRIYTDPNVSGTFDICVADRPPSNDDCTGSANLSVGFACSNIAGSMAFATPSVTPLGGTCTGSLVADVWYKFTAVNNTATVTLNNVSGITGARIEVLSGSCGSFTTVACGASPLVMAGTLTTGTTYYVRVYASSGSLPVAGASFDICITSSLLPGVKYGNSYVNISKKTTGGVVEPGDTLEIRMTVNHTSGTMYYLRYVDNIPTHTTMLSGTGDSIRVITNEGLTFRKYTPLAGDDAATYLPTPGAGEYNIRLNLGFGSYPPGMPSNNTSTSTGGATGRMVAGSDRPRGGGGMLFATAYRVVVTGNTTDTITINPGRFLYKTANVAGNPDVILTATPFKILISDPLDLCANSIGVNNAAELGGTFGYGTTLNRSTDLTVPIAGYSFQNNISATVGLNDGRYALVKNISPRNGTNRNADRVPLNTAASYPAQTSTAYRMHGGHWDIDGDHTGTTNAIGNIPPDEATAGGYMLMVNADFVASEVFSQTLNNLCPNTYYEFSAWFRNICPTCGMDSTAAQFAGTPTAPANGYVGVYPNLSFALDGLDYYSTGEIDLGGWEKKGFVFRTGTAQTSATFSIRNNSQGGGGNDWVMDDIAVATCLPTMSYSPTINPNVCEANPIIIADTISSFFKNYTTYKWQRSVNNGANWTDITGVTTLPDTNYYVTTYTVPHTATTLADSGNLYRVVVATTLDNLTDPNCNISDGVTITLSVMDCNPILSVDLLSFNGKLIDTKANLSWSTSQENEAVTFIVESSPDGRTFSPVAEVPGYNNGRTNHYSFTDPSPVNDKTWYRIIMSTPVGRKKHSAIIQLKNSLPDFELSGLINPFRNTLAFNISSATSSVINIELIDMAGKKVLSNKQLVYAGINSINLAATQSLPSGIYTLRIINKDRMVVSRVVKNN